MLIKPGVVIEVYPPNSLWLLGFAVAGCKWARDAIEKNEEAFKLRLRIDLYAVTFGEGEGI